MKGSVSGYPSAKMEYEKYEKVVKATYGVKLVGWPEGHPMVAPSKMKVGGAACISELWVRLKNNTCYFQKLDDAEKARLQEKYGINGKGKGKGKRAAKDESDDEEDAEETDEEEEEKTKKKMEKGKGKAVEAPEKKKKKKKQVEEEEEEPPKKKRKMVGEGEEAKKKKKKVEKKKDESDSDSDAAATTATKKTAKRPAPDPDSNDNSNEAASRPAKKAKTKKIVVVEVPAPPKAAFGKRRKHKSAAYIDTDNEEDTGDKGGEEDGGGKGGEEVPAGPSIDDPQGDPFFIRKAKLRATEESRKASKARMTALVSNAVAGPSKPRAPPKSLTAIAEKDDESYGGSDSD